MKKKIVLSILFLSSLIFTNSCSNSESENPNEPAVVSLKAPPLLFPSSNSSNLSTSITFSWNESEGAVQYSLQVSTNESFSELTVELNSIKSLSAQLTQLNISTKYYWRVKSIYSNGDSPWSEQWSFTTTAGNSIPPIPSLVDPLNNSTNVSIPAILKWNKSNNADLYEIQVSTNINFNTLVYSQTVSSTSTLLYNQLSGSTTYYWRIRASNSLGTSEWSSQVWSFKTLSGQSIPHAPLLITPVNGANSKSNPVNFSWYSSYGATSYTLQISDNRDFPYPYTYVGLIVTSIQVSSYLFPDRIYYWRVSATNQFGTSPFSTIRAFNTFRNSTINIPCTGIPTVTYAGKIYNTVQIGNQCWLKENLDIGTAINSNLDQSNNGIIEKHCYSNNPNNCTEFGGLYQWGESVQYYNGATNTQSPSLAFSGNVQGICPNGWHLPSYSDFQELLTAVKNDGNSLKGADEGIENGAGTNFSGFSALLVGYRFINGVFYNLGDDTGFWCATEGNSTLGNSLYLSKSSNEINFYGVRKSFSLSVRCVKD